MLPRFGYPRKLVKYVGLDPAFDDSGEGQWSGGVGGHGNKHLRSMLVQAAQAILRCSQTPLAKWGKKLLARKLTVALWYPMMGKWTSLEELDPALEAKVTKIIGRIGLKSPKSRRQLRECARWLAPDQHQSDIPPTPWQHQVTMSGSKKQFSFPRTASINPGAPRNRSITITSALATLLHYENPPRAGLGARLAVSL